MQQDTNQQREQPHILDQITTQALPPEFRHAEIARNYQDGVFTSRLDAEIEDILSGCQRGEEPGNTVAITLSDRALEMLGQLNYVALIQDGQVLPLLNIEKGAAPLTAMEKVRLYQAAARALLEAIENLFEGGNPCVSRDDDEGEGCFV